MLTELDAITDADLFRFTSLPPQPSRHQLEQLFVRRSWYRPFSQEPTALLPGMEEHGA